MPLFGPPGQRISYEVYPHPADAPPIVLVHGFTASAASFAANIEGLSQHFTVITAELLGHGSSDAPADPAAYAPDHAVRRLIGLIDHLGYERVLLCGHSLGGALALRVALDAPEWVAGVVVINSSSAAGDPAWRESARQGMASMAARVRDEGTGFLRGTRLYPAHSRRLDPDSREMLVRDFDRLQPAGFAGTAESLVAEVNAWERHPELEVPLLLVVGDRDADFAPKAEGFADRLPRGLARTVHLPEAGHAANIEQPREFESATVAFARSIGYLAAPQSAGAGASRMMTALGGVLVVAGIGLLTAAIFVNNGNSDSGGPILAAPAPTEEVRSSPTPQESTAGTRSAGPANAGGMATATAGAASATPAVSPTAAASPTKAPPTATPTTRPAVQQPPATATPTATPTESPTPAPTSTPAGPYAAISGPASAAVGESAIFVDASAPGAQIQTWTWTTPAGTTRHVPAVSVAFQSPGCYAITLTTLFKDGQSRTTSTNIAVGGATCN